MAQYIDRDRVVAEIDSIEYETNYEPFTDEVFGKRKVCKDIKDFINTLEVKEVDLWTELSNYIEHYRNRETGYTLFGIAKHFFELGLRAQKGE